MAKFSKSQIDKLGDRLRASTPIDEAAMELLEQVRLEYGTSLTEAERVLRDELRLQPTSRLKTVNGIIDKLRREKTRLSTIQDLAGLRVVVARTEDQEPVAIQIAAAFPRVTVIDRRLRPSHGYRAVHIVASIGEHVVEIQVRTRLQDYWAQIFERLADRVGRDIRYGGQPDQASFQGKDVAQLIDDASRLSEGIAALEQRRPALALDKIQRKSEEVVALFQSFSEAGLLP